MRNTEGISYYSNGEYDQAMQSFQTAMRLNPDDSEIYYNIASTYQQQANRYNQPALLTEAEKYYRICLEKKPTPETTVCCYRGLATTLNQRGANSEALDVLRAWEQSNPTSVEPKLEIAYLLEAQGAHQEAADALEKITAYAQNDYRGFYKLGLVREKLGQDAQALTNLQTASRLNPTDRQISEKMTTLESKLRAQGTQTAGGGTTPSTAPPISDGNWQNAQQPTYAAAQTRHDRSTTTAPPISTVPPETPTDPFAGFGTSANTQISQTQASGTEAFPSYGTSTESALPAAPLGTQPAAPAAPVAPTSDGALPDGTGINPFAVPEGSNAAGTSAVAGTPAIAAAPAPAETAPAITAAAAAPSLSADLPRKIRFGDEKHGPPSTSVGSPF